jgi:hypothetical protein
MSNIGLVIGWKFNNQPGMTTVDGEIKEFPGAIPSQEDQDAWTAEYEAHVAATAYREKRAREYPEIGDQLDDLYRKGAFSEAMAAQLKAVKAAHPKGDN